MKWERAIKWIMLVSGALTFTMIYAAIAPQEFLQKNFGGTLEGPIAEIVVRNWGGLIALVGVMLIYGAFASPVRTLVLIIAGMSKALFIALLLIYGQAFLESPLGFAVVLDSAMIVLFALYLVGRPKAAAVAA